jgi:catechol 2,3-dioxygenase-like lactoylglutathione lyase family enzyme
MNNEVGKLKFMCSLITVADIKRSRDFYENVLGQKIESDYGRNVSFGGFAIHLRSHFQTLIENKEIVVGKNNFELYFEYDNLEQIVEKLKAEKVEFVHELQEQPWKQLVVRFYDPDKHIIEIGETMEYLSFRLYQQGNSFDEISKKTGLSREFIEKSVQNSVSDKHNKNVI